MMYIFVLLIFSSILFFIGLISIHIISRSRKDSLIPPGKIIYNDLHGESHSLYSKKYPLVGKPDLIIKKGWKFIPVEIKTGRHYQPKKHHVMQLIAYCQLTKEVYKKSTPYGFIIYSDTNKRFKIPYTSKEKKQLITILKQMQQMNDINQVHPEYVKLSRCNHCNMRYHCMNYDDN